MEVLIVTNGNVDEIAALFVKLQQQRSNLATETCRATVGTYERACHQKSSIHYVGSLAPFSGSPTNASH